MLNLRNFLLMLLIALLSMACGQKKPQVEQPPAEEIQFIAPIGKKIASNLAITLKGELKAAMQHGGVEDAIAICNLEALPLTDSVAQHSSFNVSIKRTSNRVRNPKNAPDPYEQLALDLFLELEANKDELPEFYIQKLTDNGQVQYNFYKPMVMENLCLICHGDENMRAPSATRMIGELYPGDEAVGYKEGDFRGLIRIKFYEPAL